MGEVVHKEPEDGAEVVLRSRHGDFYRNGRLGVTVAAGQENSDSVTFSKRWQKNTADVEEAEEAHLQSLYAGDDGVERGLDVGRGAGADHW